MKRPNINLHIEELVLHNFSPHDRWQIADAVERELSRLLATDLNGARLPQSLTGNSSRPQVNAGSFRVGAGSKTDSVGSQIANAVYGGITK